MMTNMLRPFDNMMDTLWNEMKTGHASGSKVIVSTPMISGSAQS